MTSKKKITIGVCIVLCLAVGLVAALFLITSKKANTTVSGVYLGNQEWSGEMIVTGDTEIIGNLTVLPGTVVKFVVGDDQKRGDEVPKDGFNDNDPTRLKSYTTTHSGLFVLRKLIARGTAEQKITFTSGAEKPYLADWESLVFRGNGSIVENVVVEYTRNGINPIGKQPDSIITNSISRHAFWGAISSANSSISIINNYLSDAGHEGIDLKYDGAVQVVRGNTIEDCHTGIAVIKGSATVEQNTIKNCGDGIFVDPDATPTVSNNTIVLAPDDAKREWRYESYVIPLFDYPE